LPKPDGKKPEPVEPTARPEVVVLLPVPHSALVTATGIVKGSRKSEAGIKAAEDLPQILDDVKCLLQNQDERRAHPRYPASFPVRVFPLYSDGDVGPPIAGRCEDISMGGVRIAIPAPIRTQRMFVEFQEVGTVAGLAVYARHLRTHTAPEGKGAIAVCRFRIPSS
jgi:hypothetical protein